MRRKFLALLPFGVLRLMAAQTRIDAPGQIQGTIPVTLPFAFADAEVPLGTLDGKNAVFTLAHSPQGASLQLIRNGLTLMVSAANAANDYSLSGNTITFNSTATANAPLGAVPQPGDNLQAWYRY